MSWDNLFKNQNQNQTLNPYSLVPTQPTSTGYDAFSTAANQTNTNLTGTPTTTAIPDKMNFEQYQKQFDINTPATPSGANFAAMYGGTNNANGTDSIVGADGQMHNVAGTAVFSPNKSLDGSTNNFGMGSMFDGMTNQDMWQGLGATAQLGLGAYGMFKGIGQQDDMIDNARAKTQISRDALDYSISEDKRKQNLYTG
jgi:hypothetical protein